MTTNLQSTTSREGEKDVEGKESNRPSRRLLKLNSVSKPDKSPHYYGQ